MPFPVVFNFYCYIYVYLLIPHFIFFYRSTLIFPTLYFLSISCYLENVQPQVILQLIFLYFHKSSFTLRFRTGQFSFPSVFRNIVPTTQMLLLFFLSHLCFFLLSVFHLSTMIFSCPHYFFLSISLFNYAFTLRIYFSPPFPRFYISVFSLKFSRLLCLSPHFQLSYSLLRLSTFLNLYQTRLVISFYFQSSRSVSQ